MKKILVITNIPTPYRVPLFAELNQQLAQHGMQLKVIFAALGYARRKYKIDLSNCGFEYEVLDSGIYTAGNNSEVTYFDYKGLTEVVKREQPYRCIISGFSAGTMQLFVRSFFKPTPFIIWSGSLKKKGRNDNWARKLQRHIISRRARAFIAYGSLSKQYLLEELNVPASRIAIARNTIDTTFFRTETERLRKEIAGTDQKKHLLHIGYLVPRKNVALLLFVIEKLSRIRQDFILDIVGDGESRPFLEQYIRDHKLEEFVRMHGYRQKEELPSFLARSLVFLFQTDFDIWGLTLNEAMAAGLPCLSSVNAGASVDLVEEGRTGWTVDFRNADMVLEKLSYLMDHPEKAMEMGRFAQEKIENTASLKISAAGFIEAIRLSE